MRSFFEAGKNYMKPGLCWAVFLAMGLSLSPIGAG
jgi:hypothetical protein